MVRSRLRLAGVVGVGAGLTIAAGALLPGRDFLELMRGTLLSVSAGVAAAHWPDAKAVIRSNRVPLLDYQVLATGYFLIAGSIALWAAWYLVWINLGSPDLWWDEYLLGFLSLLGIVGSIIVLGVARSNDEGYVSMREWGSIGIRTAVGVALVLLSLAGLRALMHG